MSIVREMVELAKKLLLPPLEDAVAITPLSPFGSSALVLQRLGRIGEQVAAGMLLQSVLEPKTEPNHRYANARTLLRG